MGRIYKPTRRQADGSVWTSPRWYCEYTDADGRQRRRPASSSKKKAQALLQELEGQAQRIRLGLEEAKPKNSSPLIEDLARNFLADQKHHLKPRTFVGYEESLKDLFQGGVANRDKPWLPKAKKVSDLTPELVRDYQRRAVETLSPRSTNRKIRNLTAMLSWALRQGLIPSNPLAGIKHLSEKPQAPLRALEEDEITRLLEESPPDARQIWQLFLDTGMRLSELATLRVADVNLKAGQLTIREEVSKNDRPRTIPMTKTVKDILVDCSNRKPEELVVQGIDTWADLKQGALKVFRRCCRKAMIDLAGVNVHALRRTFATRLLARGASPAAVQKLLGHATANLTLEVYARARAADLEDAINALNHQKND